jgi:hypothetical protein
LVDFTREYWPVVTAYKRAGNRSERTLSSVGERLQETQKSVLKRIVIISIYHQASSIMLGYLITSVVSVDRP